MLPSIACRSSRGLITRNFNQLQWTASCNMSKDDKSAGGVGGGAGSIRGAGGKFAERESALEGEYFHKLEREQLAKLKTHLHDEIKHHEEEIKRHQEAIQRHKSKAAEIDKASKK